MSRKDKWSTLLQEDEALTQSSERLILAHLPSTNLMKLLKQIRFRNPARSDRSLKSCSLLCLLDRKIPRPSSNNWQFSRQLCYCQLSNNRHTRYNRCSLEGCNSKLADKFMIKPFRVQDV
ncbi:hypothetical protein PENVUL_c008G00627 [Penicillium vulpinum]|uniref:Uncharacterized protein n=1 Tax=Penicillium vulpinum TaxID=29845 RepID=A0A1V6S457_9EURO|nr:hypothetical protein PENVUL_c008G00627 [Penicillium vulpinum]